MVLLKAGVFAQIKTAVIGIKQRANKGNAVDQSQGRPADHFLVDQKNLTLMQTVSHSPRFAAHPVYQGRIPIRAVPDGQAEKVTLFLTTEQMDLLIEDLALHIGSCKMAGWAAQAEVE